MIDDKGHYDVFLSYSKNDLAWVEEFASTLRHAGITTWSDEDIKPGDNWQLAIEQALRQSSTLVLVLNQNNINSPLTFFELGAAIAGKKKIIPVLTGDMDISQLPAFVRHIQILRTESPTEAGKRVAEVLAP